MNELDHNPDSETNLNEFIMNQYDPKERENSMIKIAYMISIAALKLAINGIGSYSNSELIFFGIQFFPNATNLTKSIFTIKKNKIIPFSLQICKEIQGIIKEPFF